MRTSAAEWAISMIVGLVLLSVLAVSALTAGQPGPRGVVKEFAPEKRLSAEPETSQYSTALGLGFLGIGVGPAHQDGKNVVRMHYFLPFLIVSVHLLVVLIGAAYLARAKRRKLKDEA
jgi:NADH-quinone oxidoreductase subunit J